MEPHAIVVAWDGNRLSIDMPSQGLVMTRARIAGLFGLAAGEHPYPQPVSRRRLWLEGIGGRPANARHHGGEAGRTAGQARAARATRCTGRSAIARRPARRMRIGTDARRRACRDHAPCQDRDQHIRRFLRAGRERLRRTLCEPRNRGFARGRAHRYRHADVHARARRSARLDGAGERASTKRRGPAAWTRWHSA